MGRKKIETMQIIDSERLRQVLILFLHLPNIISTNSLLIFELKCIYRSRKYDTAHLSIKYSA